MVHLGNRFALDFDIAADGRIVLTSDHGFVAGEREGTADRRRLAIRVYSLTVEGK